MSVHCVQIVASPSPIPDLVDDVRAAHGAHTEALPEQAVEFTEVPEDKSMGIPPHGRGIYRYKESENLGTVLDNLEASIPPATPWYALYYHLCDHDLPSHLREGCTWESSPRRAKGPVPSEVTP